MARVVLNRAFKVEVQREVEFKAGMTLKTDEAAEAAHAAAPEKTGYYKRRVKALHRINVAALDELQKDATPPRGDGYAIADTDPFAHLVEGGSVNNPPYAPLQVGARAAGLRLEDHRTP